MPTPSIWLPAAHSSSAKKRKLIYFICGNPGLIEFYRPFLTYLRGLLDGADVDHAASLTAYDIYGQNLPGFSDDAHERPFSREDPPWDVGGTVGRVYEDLKGRGGEYEEVCLMGHSVGSFIGVEIFDRFLRDEEERMAKKGEGKKGELKIGHGILLFPTVAHLALSPSGRVFTFLMRFVPLLKRHAHVLARLIVSLIPVFVLELYLARVLGFEGGAARTTVGWLKSRDGVRQTLWLAGDEMEVIAGEERWGRGIWEVEDGGQGGLPRFFMFYGKRDHWVDDGVRDEFVERMRRRGEEGGRVPRIVVDGEGRMKHAFCTRDDSSFEVAKRVSGWIGEIEKAGRRE